MHQRNNRPDCPLKKLEVFKSFISRCPLLYVKIAVYQVAFFSVIGALHEAVPDGDLAPMRAKSNQRD